MAITRVGGTQGGAANAGAVTLTLPGGMAVGDLIIIAAGNGDNDGTNPSLTMTTGGYTNLLGATLHGNNASVGDASLAIFYKFHNGTDTNAVVAAGGTGNDSASAHALQVFRGVHPATPFEVTSTTATGTSGGDPNPPSISGFTEASSTVVIAGCVGSAAAALTLTAPTNYVTNATKGTGSDTFSASTCLAYRLSGAADPEDPAVFSDSGTGGGWAAVTMVLKEKPPPTAQAVAATTTVTPAIVTHKIIKQSVAATTSVTAALATEVIEAPPQPVWTESTPGTDPYNDVAYGNGYWVAVGDTAKIAYTTDPTGTWTTATVGSQQFTGVAYGNGYWVAVGANGTVYYRADNPAGSWTSNTQGAGFFGAVAYGNGYWCALGDNGYLYYKATNPVGAWTANTQSGWMYAVTYGNGYWVSAGAGGDVLYRATDPTGAWTVNAQSTTTRRDIIYSNRLGLFISAGENGTLISKAVPSGSWTSTQQTGGGSQEIRSVADDETGSIVAVEMVGEQVAFGNAPTTQLSFYDTRTFEPHRVRFANGYWVIVGGNGDIAVAPAVSTGTQTPQAVDATTTVTADLVRLPRKAFAITLSAGIVLARKTKKTLAAAMTSVMALTKRIPKLLPVDILSMRGPTQNLMPDLAQWDHSSGSTYDSATGEWTITNGHTITSPWVRCDTYTDWTLVFDAWTDDASTQFTPLGGYLITTDYVGYDKGAGARNSAGFTGNGNAPDSGIPLQTWDRYTWEYLVGGDVKYIRVTFTNDATYVGTTSKIRRVDLFMDSQYPVRTFTPTHLPYEAGPTITKSKVITRVVAAAVALTAAVARKTGKIIPAAVTATLAMARRTKKPVAAAMTATMALTRRSTRIIAATTALTVSAARKTLKTIAGAITFTANLITEKLAGVVVRGNSAEGGTDGVTVTNGNSGGTSGDAFTRVGHYGGSAKFSNAHPSTGSMGLLMTDVAGRTTIGWDESWGTSVYGRVYVYYTGTGGSDYITFEPWTVMGSAWSPYALWYLGGVNTADLRDSPNATVATGSAPLEPDTLYRVEWHTVSHASAGSIEVRLYAGHSTTPLDTVSATGLTGNGADLTTIAYGHYPSSGDTVVYMDDFGASTVTWLGPTGVAPILQAVAATVTATLAVVRKVAKPLPVAVTATLVVARKTAKTIGAAMTSIIALTKRSMKAVPVTTALVIALSRRVARTVAAATTLVVALPKVISKQVVAATTLTVALARTKVATMLVAVTSAIGAVLIRLPRKQIAVVTTVVVGLTRRIPKVIAAGFTATMGLTLTKAVRQAVAAVTTVGAAINRRTVKIVSAGTSVLAGVLKRIPQHVDVTTVFAVALNGIKTLMRAIAVGVTFGVGVARRAGKLVSVTITHTVGITMLKTLHLLVAAATTVVVAIGRRVPQLVAAGVLATAALARRVGKRVDLTSALTVGFIRLKVFTRAISAATTIGVAMLRRTAKTLALTITETVALARKKLAVQAIGAVVTLAAQITRRSTEVLAVGLTMGVGVLRRIPQRIAASTTVTAAVTRLKVFLRTVVVGTTFVVAVGRRAGKRVAAATTFVTGMVLRKALSQAIDVVVGIEAFAVARVRKLMAIAVPFVVETKRRVGHRVVVLTSLGVSVLHAGLRRITVAVTTALAVLVDAVKPLGKLWVQSVDVTVTIVIGISRVIGKFVAAMVGLIATMGRKIFNEIWPADTDGAWKQDGHDRKKWPAGSGINSWKADD